jgi:hypothetical protein
VSSPRRSATDANAPKLELPIRSGAGLDARTLYRLGGAAAIVGGVLRIGAAFAPSMLSEGQAQALYLVVDVFLLAGLLAVYARYAVVVGWIGLVGFLAALIGFCLIRTGVLFGMETYAVGGGLCLFGAAFIGSRMPADPGFPRLAPMLWMAAVVIGVAGAFWPMVAWGVALAAILFALGFAAAGVALIRGAGRG